MYTITIRLLCRIMYHNREREVDWTILSSATGLSQWLTCERVSNTSVVLVSSANESERHTSRVYICGARACTSCTHDISQHTEKNNNNIPSFCFNIVTKLVKSGLFCTACHSSPVSCLTSHTLSSLCHDSRICAAYSIGLAGRYAWNGVLTDPQTTVHIYDINNTIATSRFVICHHTGHNTQSNPYHQYAHVILFFSDVCMHMLVYPMFSPLKQGICDTNNAHCVK